MKSKSLRGTGGSSAPLLGLENERMASVKGSGSNPATLKPKRARVYQPPRRESEKSVEVKARVAIAALGVMVKKHVVESCYSCGSPPKAGTGLGKGTSDLFCIVPPLGRVVFIEMKRPGYSPSDVSDEQRAFIRAVKLFGGIAGVASSVEEAVALVKLAMVVP